MATFSVFFFFCFVVAILDLVHDIYSEAKTKGYS